MTDPKTLTDERDRLSVLEWAVDKALDNLERVYRLRANEECGPGAVEEAENWLTLCKQVLSKAERATREQTASTGEPPDLCPQCGDYRHAPDDHCAPGGQAVAEVGPGWTLVYAGDGPLAALCARHPRLRIGAKLYLAPLAAPVEQAGSPPLVNPAQPFGKEKTAPWIPVHQRLPISYSSVLVWGPWKPVITAFCFENGRWAKDVDQPFDDGAVTHWMPLPKAPADCDSKATSLEPGAPERDAKKGSTPDETLREALAERKPRDIILYNGDTSEPYIDIDGADLWCNADDFAPSERWKIRWMVDAARRALATPTKPEMQSVHPAAVFGTEKTLPCRSGG